MRGQVSEGNDEHQLVDKLCPLQECLHKEPFEFIRVGISDLPSTNGIHLLQIQSDANGSSDQ
jgi:hypothetical protein